MSKMKLFCPAVILSLFLLQISCVNFSRGPKPEMYGTIEYLGIDEEIVYPASPFGPLVDEVFPRRKGQSSPTHYVNVLDIGEEALLARIHLIRQAKKAIYIQTFIWTDDETGRRLIYELIEAAKRGVKVKVIVDQWRSMKDSSLVAFMVTAHPNLEVKNYNPNTNRINPPALALIRDLILKFKQVNQRMHNKLFIIDDRIAITGGRNYENDYYDRGVTRNFKDRDVIIIGPVVREMTSSFMRYWAFKLSVPSKDLVDVSEAIKKGSFKKRPAREDFNLGGLFDDLECLLADPLYIKEALVDKAFPVEKVKFVADRPGKNDSFGLTGGGVAASELAKIISQAKKSIVVQTPYLVLDPLAIKGVKKLRRENPDLDILISSNSLAATDSIYAYAFSYKQKKMFVKNLRFRIFEAKPAPADIVKMMPRYTCAAGDYARAEEWPAHGVLEEDNTLESKKKHLCIHAKSLVIDDEVVLIGSFNVDPRSTHLNTEAVLVLWDKPLAAAVKNNIRRDMSPPNSWTIGKCKEVPVISLFSGLLANILKYIPFIDIWPFRYTANFELREGKEIVPFYHPDFYENYVSVGSFPEVAFSLKEIEIRLLKAFGGVVAPII